MNILTALKILHLSGEPGNVTDTYPPNENSHEYRYLSDEGLIKSECGYYRITQDGLYVMGRLKDLFPELK